jgi:hypothetical protein
MADIQIAKDKIKLSLFADVMTSYTGNPEDYNKHLSKNNLISMCTTKQQQRKVNGPGMETYT